MLFFMPCFSLVVRNLSARLRTLAHMQVKARRRLAALRTVAEKNEEIAQAITIDAVDNEAVEEVRCEALEEVSATTKILGMFSAVLCRCSCTRECPIEYVMYLLLCFLSPQPHR